MSENSKPFSIRIFLPDGTPDGVRIVEKSNWTGVGVVVPRGLLSEAKKRCEFDRTGVYVLVGQEDDNELPTIYVGLGDPVRSRLEMHLAKKDFWNWAVFFVTRDNSLNKAHVGYLEAALLELVKKSKRAKLDNGNQPQPSPLTEADAADMNSFLSDMLDIFPILNLRVFEQLKSKPKDKKLLELSAKGIQAKGYESSQGFVVVAGSSATKNENNSLSQKHFALRKELLKQGVLVEKNKALSFTQDYEFSSPSSAASVLLGGSTSGPQSWKGKDGRTLKEMREAEGDIA